MSNPQECKQSIHKYVRACNGRFNNLVTNNLIVDGNPISALTTSTIVPGPAFGLVPGSTGQIVRLAGTVYASIPLVIVDPASYVDPGAVVATLPVDFRPIHDVEFTTTFMGAPPSVGYSEVRFHYSAATGEITVVTPNPAFIATGTLVTINFAGNV
uniref:Uncharacterized protein n=1 Tax=viral metagenome TaxID=1070528 RepID=A0A6C0BQ05_9ZZZZ